jgi:GT2 family glycosyltransferase
VRIASIPASIAVIEPTYAVCAVVVNWNGWRDTVICLESLLALDHPPTRVVVCDNASTDGSMAAMMEWGNRQLHGWSVSDRGFVSPDAADGVQSIDFLQLDSNLGYAGGINAGIEWGRQRWPLQAFWLLNNDVYAEPGALSALIAASDAVPRAGICGSVLLEWDNPAQVLAIAGLFRKWLGVGWHSKDVHAGTDDVAVDLDYPVGASMFVRAEYLDEVGSMDPSYFLYCEEMDWVERGRRRGFIPIVALKSRLRHREGASTGSHGGARGKSLLSERYGVINRLRITRKFWPWLLPLVWISLAAVVLDRALHREHARALLVLRLMASPSLWLR